jgi:hypothetical protein
MSLMALWIARAFRFRAFNHNHSSSLPAIPCDFASLILI